MRKLISLLFISALCLADTPPQPLTIGSPQNGLSLSGAGNRTLSLGLSSGSTIGALSSTDWSTFNGKQGALTFTSPLVNTTGTVTCNAASGSQAGCLSSTDWNTFNGKQSVLTLGNLTDAGTDGITVGNGSGAVVGTGTTLSQRVADTTHNGYLATTDWNAFNNKQSALTFTSPLVNTTGTVTCNAASGSQSGCLASADWTTFNGKQSALSFTAPLVNTSGTITCNVGSGSQPGCIASADWTTFNSKQSALTFSDSLTNSGGTVTLVNDSASPGDSMCYSTNASGVLGWNACGSGGGVTSITQGTGMSFSTTPLTTTGTISLAIPVAIASGGTNSTSVTAAPAATSWAGWDANKNMSFVSGIPGFTTTVTSATPVTLSVSSTQIQVFTGSTAQTLTLPVASTLVAGQYYWVLNESSQTVTIKSSGANTVVTLPTNQSALVVCILNSGTAAASWHWLEVPFSNTTNALPIAQGGTALTTAQTTPFASTVMSWDANKGVEAVVFNTDLTSTATAGGTTTMTIASTGIQVWTGSSTQTIKLPTTSVKAGATYTFINNSTGALSIQSSGANAILTTGVSGARAICTALIATPTTAANWFCL